MLRCPPLISSHPCLLPLPPSPPLSAHSSSSPARLRLIKYLLFLGPELFIFWSAFSAAVGSMRWLNSAVSDSPVFGLAAGDRVWDGPRGSRWACKKVGRYPFAWTNWFPSASHTAAIHSPKHTQDRVRIVWRPVAMPGMLSPSSSLGKKKVLFGSLSLSFFCLWKAAAVWWEGLQGALADLQIPAGPCSHTGPPSQRNPEEGRCLPHRYFLTQSHIPSGSFTVIAAKNRKLWGCMQ